VQASGQIVSGETAALSTRIMGFITQIYVKPGDKVRKGQLLVTISNGDIVAKRAQAAAMVSEVEAALADAQKDYDRYTALFNERSASLKELENVTLHYNAVKAKAEAARQMRNEADAMLAYANLIAPFNGVVTQKKLDAGSMASPGIPILVIEQVENFLVNTSVTELDINSISVGIEAQVIIESIGKSFTGKVTEVSPSSHMSSGQYLVRIMVPDSEKNDLHPGMYARVSIRVTEPRHVDNTVMIPANAVIDRDQLTGIYTVGENNTALLRWVKLGKRQGNAVEVLSGLRYDEQFIVSADGPLYNGVSVVIK